VRTLRLTDAFIWEDLPHTDPDTGYLAMVAWIPRIKRVTTFITGVAIIMHVTLSVMLLFASDDHSMVYHTWYPFLITKSPTYELINIAQVTVYVKWNTVLPCAFYCMEENADYTRRGQ
jgi:hypothetical protein